MLTAILKLICIMIAVAGLNEHFQHQQRNRKYKNLYQEAVLKYDSLITQEVDSLLTTIQK